MSNQNKRYKYKTITGIDKALSEAELNREGNAGWELITVNYGKYDFIYYIFKKEAL